MRSGNLSFIYSILVLGAVLIPAHSKPQQRYSAEEFGRKFNGKLDLDTVNDLVPEHKSVEQEIGFNPAERQDEGLLQTVLGLVVEFMPTIIGLVTGTAGPSKTDKIDDIQIDPEDPFSVKNVLVLVVKVALAYFGDSGDIDRNGNSDVDTGLQSATEVLVKTGIQYFTGSKDAREVEVMTKQVTEVMNLVLSLVEALSTSMSSQRRSIQYYK